MIPPIYGHSKSQELMAENPDFDVIPQSLTPITSSAQNQQEKIHEHK
jgi:hypothetical protein